MPSSNIVLVIALVCVAATGLQAQTELCPGALGENIFTDGDFGSGSENIYPVDPGLAPGYQYSTVVPFDDGMYTLTNSSLAWPNNWSTWLFIGDNSNDPQGYMMIVNASFAPGIFYEKTVSGVCENTVYEFSADVINFIQTHVPNHILPNVSFFIDDELYFSTGPIPQDMEWKKVGFTFVTQPGQTEVKLTLRNNAPGGVGNDLALDNVSFRACGPSSKVTTNTPGIICEDADFPTLSAEIEDDSLAVIQWQISTDNGLVWTDLPGGTTPAFQVGPVPPGQYVYRFVHATSLANLQNTKCRTVSDILALEVVPLHFLIIDTICEGLSYPLGNENYTEAGIYSKTFTSSIGCDSIVTLDLTIHKDPHFEPQYEISGPTCYGGPDGSIVLVEVPGGVEPFFFQVSGEVASVRDSLILPTGSYMVYIEDHFGCNHVGEYEIPETPEFVLEGLVDTSIILGHKARQVVQANYPIQSILWSPIDGLSCSDCLDIIAAPFITTQYEISAISEESCIARATVLIEVKRIAHVYVPNVFTPNNDGVNDDWGVGVDDVNIATIGEVVIFDRWGGVIFSDQNIPVENAASLWDGKADGQFVGPGVYTYLLRLILIDNTIINEAGNLTVLR